MSAARAAVLAALLGSAAPAADLPARAFLAEHCAACHDADTRKGGFDVASLTAAFDDPVAAGRWVRVIDRISAGEMPPPNKPRPPKADADAATKAVADALVAGESARRARDGRSVVRRLNRLEFEHTLRDLLELPWLEVRDLLPDDGRDPQGYTKSAAALDVSPVLLSKYEEAIDKALAAAVAKWAVPPEVERRTLYANQQYDFKILMSGGDAVMLTPDKKYDDTRFPMPAATNADGKYPGGMWSFGGKYKGLGEAEKGGAFKEPSTVGMTRTFGESFGGRFNFGPVHPGRYKVGVSAWSYWWDKGEVKPAPRTGAVGVYCGSRVLGFFDAPSLKPTVSEVTVDLEPKPDGVLRAAGASFLDAHVYFSQGQVKGYAGPGVAIDKFTVEGPLYDEWPPAGHRRLFGSLPVVPFHKLPPDFSKPARPPVPAVRNASNGPGRLVPGATVPEDATADARKLLTAFLPRAFRRPVSSPEVERYAAVADARVKDGAAFEDAMLGAYRTALLSPDFLFLREPVGPLDGHALASRLSYFLWNSCPDDALLTAAKAGKLADPAGLRAETDRLLADPKADRFFQDFPDQWLDLRDFDATSPDKQLYPEFHPLLEDAMRREPREFFKYAVAHRLAAAELVRTPVNVVSQRLAEHYGLPNAVDGTRFRRTDVDQSKLTRGGFLTMAAVCKVTANGTTTSPVKRGAWVMKKVLGRPPQPPPPDVPAVEPDVKGATTIREQLAKHRDNPGCASCHAKFDPPGFALEGFDPIGGRRSFYRATEGKKGADLRALYPGFLGPDNKFGGHFHVGFREGPPVDPSGELADGRTFADLRGYQELLLANPRDFSRNLAKQLVLYATGAPVGFADRAAVEDVLTKAGGSNPPVRSLIAEVVQSPLFRNK